MNKKCNIIEKIEYIIHFNIHLPFLHLTANMIPLATDNEILWIDANDITFFYSVL